MSFDLLCLVTLLFYWEALSIVNKCLFLLQKQNVKMNLRSSAELSKLLGTYLSPRSPVKRPSSLHTLCLRTAAIYATTALYEFNDKHKSLSVNQSTFSSTWDDVFPLLDAHFLR